MAMAARYGKRRARHLRAGPALRNRHIGVSLNYDFFQSRANGIYQGRFNTGMYGGTFEYRF